MINPPFHDEPGRCLHCQQPLEPRALNGYCSSRCQLLGEGGWERKLAQQKAKVYKEAGNDELSR